MSIHTRVSGAWKPVQSYVRVSGAWKAIPQVWVKKDGTWTTLYTFSWETGSWGDCSATCGGGTQTRTVQALRSDGTYWSDTIGAMFAGDKPSTSQTCNTGSCSEEYYSRESGGEYYWRADYGSTTGDCSGCSASSASRDVSINAAYVFWDGSQVIRSSGYMNYLPASDGYPAVTGGYAYYAGTLQAAIVCDEEQSYPCIAFYSIVREVV